MKETVQEQLANARRTQILDAAAKVFAEKGFHPTTVKDIAREAGIADGTIYIYFENKTALLLGVFDLMRESIQPKVTPFDLAAPDLAMSDPSAIEFRDFLKAYFHYPLMALQGDNFALFRVIASEMMVNKEVRELYFQRILQPAIMGGEQLMQQWATRGVIKPVNMALTVRAISGIVLGLIMENIMGDDTLKAQWEALPDFLADLFLNGIGNDPGENQS